MLRINTRYVSSVSIGYRMKNTTPHSRYEPYKYTNERHRTKSENFEAEEKLLMKNFDILDTYKEEVNQLKRAKSLESIVAEGNQIIDLKNINMNKINELEVVSSSIQNLKVAEWVMILKDLKS